MRLKQQQSFRGGPMSGKPKQRHPVVQPLDKPYKLIALTQGQNVIVDATDFEWLSQWNWFAMWNPFTRSFYANRRVKTVQINGKRRHIKISMAAQILDPKKGEIIDHRNHDTLDNRKDNLRKATRSQNVMNVRHKREGQYKGVHRRDNKKFAGWRSMIGVNKKLVHLGTFRSPEEAARAYDEAAKKHFGEFAWLNFPD